MNDTKRHRLAGMLPATLLLMGAGGLLSACNTVEGVGQDMTDLGHYVATDARQAQQQIPPPQPPPPR